LAAHPAAYNELERTFVNQSRLAAARKRSQSRLTKLLVAAAILIVIGVFVAGMSALRANESASQAIQAAKQERSARATVEAARIIAEDARAAAVVLADLANEQAATAEAALTAQVALAESLSAMLTLAAPTTTPTPEPTPLATPTPPATPAAGRTPAPDTPGVTPVGQVMTPTLIAFIEPAMTPPDLVATATAQVVLDTAQNALDQFGPLPTDAPDGVILPLRSLPTDSPLFESLPDSADR
jgi:hypothetical protein